jgi:predicted O-methyltransferase YrrM
MKPSRTLNIKDYFRQHEIDLDQISLGEFDQVGEYTAKRTRDPGSELFKRVGAFFKPNLERAILMTSLAKKHRLSSYLEVGFGRGYSAICMAKAFHEMGNDGKVMVVEPNVDDNFMNAISQVFPQEWLAHIQIARGKSQDILPQLKDSYDIVYIDGDHSKEAVTSDWNNLKDRWSCFCLLDDWHEELDTDPGIQVHEALADVVQPDGTTCELIKMDRRIFPDDRGWSDEQVKYGQLLLTRESSLVDRDKEIAFKETWDW